MSPASRRLLIVAATLMASLSALFVKWSDAPSMVLVFYRMFFASAVVVPVTLVLCRKDLLGMGREDLLLSILSGIVFAVHFATYFESLDHISIASCLVLTDTAVFFVAVIMVFFGESLSRKGWGIIAVTFGGCVMISLSDMSLGTGLMGDGLALVSALMFALNTIIGRRVRGRVSTLAYTSVLYSTAALVSLVIIAADDITSLDCGTNNLLCGLGLAVFCTLLGHSVFNWGLRFEKAAFVALTTLLEPVFGTAMGMVLFGEMPSLLVLAGGAVVLAGVYLFARVTAPEESA